MLEKKLDKNKMICGAVFAVYAVLTLICALNHELWFDEAQAWTISRDNDIGGIINQLGYEGHPPLWYLILYVFARMGFDCTVIPLISWFVTALAAAVIMFRSPFNTAVKTAVLISGGFIFYNSVISRVYCIINLAVALIAWLYPKRKKHPILFGILVALLANTHVCMSGLIGIIGIFMITDLLKGFRTNSAKQNAAEIAGLAVSGAGVLTMVLPLLNSLSLNVTTSSNEISFRGAAVSVLESFLNISLSLFGYERGFVVFLISAFTAILFVWAIILMRHKIRPFLMLVFFCVFYIITSEIFWFSIPSRSHIFLLVFLAAAWIAEYEPEKAGNKKPSEAVLKTDSKFIRRILEFFAKADRKFLGAYTAVITAIFIVTAPGGFYCLFSDCAKQFEPSAKTAEYVRENLPAGSVFVTSDEFAASLAAYLPEYRFYSLDYGEFYTYYTHKAQPESVSSEHIYDDLRDCGSIYFLTGFSDIDALPSSRNIIYSCREGLSYGVTLRYLEISEFNLEKEIKGTSGQQ